MSRRADGVVRGQKVRAIVTDAWGNEVAKPEAVIDPGAADRWLALPVAPLAELAPGGMGSSSLPTTVHWVSGVRRDRRGNVGATSAGDAGQPQVRSTVPRPGGGRGATDPAGKRLPRWRLPASVLPGALQSVPLPRSEGDHTIGRRKFASWPRTTPNGEA